MRMEVMVGVGDVEVDGDEQGRGRGRKMWLEESSELGLNGERERTRLR